MSWFAAMRPVSNGLCEAAGQWHTVVLSHDAYAKRRSSCAPDSHCGVKETSVGWPQQWSSTLHSPRDSARQISQLKQHHCELTCFGSLAKPPASCTRSYSGESLLIS